MNTCCDSTRPNQRRGWNENRRKKRGERIAPALRGAQAGRLSRAPRLGVLKPPTSVRVAPTRRAPPGMGSRLRRQVCRWWSCEPDFELSRSELRDADRGPTTSILGPRTSPRTKIALAENVACSWLARSDHGVIACLQTSTTRSRSARSGRVPAARRERWSRRMICSGCTGPYGLALGASSTAASWRTREQGDTAARSPAQDSLEGPIRFGRPGVTGRRVSASAAAGFRVLKSGPGTLDRLRFGGLGGRPPISRGELQFTSRRRGASADALGSSKSNPRLRPIAHGASGSESAPSTTLAQWGLRPTEPGRLKVDAESANGRRCRRNLTFQYGGHARSRKTDRYPRLRLRERLHGYFPCRAESSSGSPGVGSAANSVLATFSTSAGRAPHE